MVSLAMLATISSKNTLGIQCIWKECQSKTVRACKTQKTNGSREEEEELNIECP